MSNDDELTAEQAKTLLREVEFSRAVQGLLNAIREFGTWVDTQPDAYRLNHELQKVYTMSALVAALGLRDAGSDAGLTALVQTLWDPENA